MTLVAFLHEQISVVCPIESVSIGRQEDKTTWSITFKPVATEIQKVAAQAVITNFNPTVADLRSGLANALDAALSAVPSIDPRIKIVFMEWRKQIT